jgi:heptosyltransferase-2
VHLIPPPGTPPHGERMPGVRQSRVFDAAHGRLDLLERIGAGRALRGAYDLAIVLPRSLKAAVIPFSAGVPARRGYVGEMRYGALTETRKLDKARLPRTVDQFTALARVDGETPMVQPPVLMADGAAGSALAERLELSLERPVIALCPGAEYGPAKQWPAEHFAELGRQLAASGSSLWLFGSPKEQPLGEEIARVIGPNATNLAGRTKLLESLDLLGLTSGAVSNDSGLMHVASALGLPVVGIYGSTSPDVTPPLGARAMTAQIELACRPCFERTCPLGHLDCLRKLSVADVAAKLTQAMASA